MSFFYFKLRLPILKLDAKLRLSYLNSQTQQINKKDRRNHGRFLDRSLYLNTNWQNLKHLYHIQLIRPYDNDIPPPPTVRWGGDLNIFFYSALEIK